MNDILGPVLRGEVGLDRLDHTWLLEALREHRPGVPDKLLRESYMPGRPPIHALWWDEMEGPLRATGAPEAEIAEWRVAEALVSALDYPLEKLFETVQFVRSAIRVLEKAAEARADPAERAAGHQIVAAVAYAFATIDADDEDYDLRKAAAERVASRQGRDP